MNKLIFSRHKDQDQNKGFTLVELLLVVALTALAVGVTGDILISLIRGYNKTQVINEIEQNANFVSQKLNKELRNAIQVTEIGSDSGSDLGVGDSGNNITFENNDGISITYRVDEGSDVLYRNHDGTGEEALTKSASPDGVIVECNPTGECFELISTNPQVVQISIEISQAGSDTVFQGSIPIDDAIVIRDTY